MPYYKISDTTVKNGDKPTVHLVRAKNQAQALSAIVDPRYTIEVAEQQDLIDLTASGVKLIDATEK